MGLVSKKIDAQAYGYLENKIISKDIFCSINFNENPKENQFMNQIYAEFGKDISFATWANYNIEKNKATEVDYFLKKTFNIPFGNNSSINITPAFGYFVYPNSEMKDVPELSLSAVVEGLPIDLSMRFGKVFGKHSLEGYMASLTVGKGIDVKELFDLPKKFPDMSINQTMDLYYFQNYFIKGTGPAAVAVSGELTIKPSKNISISGKLTVQSRLNDDFKDNIYDTSYWSTTISTSF